MSTDDAGHIEFWIPCPGCARQGAIGVPRGWPAATICCPKCGCVVSIRPEERVLWRDAMTPPTRVEPELFAAPESEPAVPPAVFSAPEVIPVDALSDPKRPAPVPRLTWNSVNSVDVLLVGAFVFVVLVAIANSPLGTPVPNDRDQVADRVRPAPAQVDTELPPLAPNSSPQPPDPTEPSFFGIKAVGRKFTFLIDTSTGMGEGTRDQAPLDQAKVALIKGLKALQTENAFRVISYQKRRWGSPVATIAVEKGGLQVLVACEAIARLRADGEPVPDVEPIRTALQGAPDAIFLFTTARERQWSETDFALVHAQNYDRTAINVVEFGPAPRTSTDGLLQRLAKENGGMYRYIEVARPPSSPQRGPASPPRSASRHSEPVSVYFKNQERVVFEVQIPHALQLFDALNGRKPQSHEEFMKEIIQVNNIKLPNLPSGHTYKYDPTTSKLMVEHPE